MNRLLPAGCILWAVLAFGCDGEATTGDAGDETIADRTADGGADVESSDAPNGEAGGDAIPDGMEGGDAMGDGGMDDGDAMSDVGMEGVEGMSDAGMDGGGSDGMMDNGGM